MNFEFRTEIEEKVFLGETEISIELEVDISVKGFQPSKPFAHCSNPSSPNFCNPPEFAEFDDYTIYYNGVVDITDKLSHVTLEKITEKIFKYGEDYCNGYNR